MRKQNSTTILKVWKNQDAGFTSNSKISPPVCITNHHIYVILFPKTKVNIFEKHVPKTILWLVGLLSTYFFCKF